MSQASRFFIAQSNTIGNFYHFLKKLPMVLLCAVQKERICANYLAASLVA